MRDRQAVSGGAKASISTDVSLGCSELSYKRVLASIHW
jgi:hypothetical protein